jgi:cytochrome P450
MRSPADRPTLDELAGPDSPSVLARLRAIAPVTWVPAIDGWLVTGHAAAVRVMRDPATFTVDDPNFSTARVVGPSMLSLDGTEHRRHRAPFVEPFRRGAVDARYSAEITLVVRELLDDVSDDGRAELRGDLAGPLAVRVVASALGLEPVDADAVLEWYAEIVGAVSALTPASQVPEGARRAMAALTEHVMAGLRSHRQSVLGAATDRLGEQDIVANAAVMLFGGIETTEGMILNALRIAIRDPGLRDALAARKELADAVVEESLRLHPAAAVVDRYATRAVEVEGAYIGSRELVRISLVAANRDPQVFPDPDAVEVGRLNSRAHLAFAQGPHVCIAADLARLETRIALVETVARLPGVRLADDVAPTGHIFRKPQTLPVRW